MVWNNLHNVDMAAASQEAATKQFLVTGVQNVFFPSPTITRLDNKFFDPLNICFVYTNQPLKDSLEMASSRYINTKL